MSETKDYEWYETPYGKFRVEQKRFGTWTRFYLEGKATNWANYQSSETYDGTVGGKL